MDRIAAGYLRKQSLLGVESALRRCMVADRKADPHRTTQERERLAVIALSCPTHADFFGLNLGYELLLDQGFHRDLILLKQLQSAAQGSAVLASRRPPTSAGKQLDDEVGISTVG